MILDEVMAAAGIEHYGVAAYEDTLPGTGFKKRELFDGMDSVIVCLIPWDTGMNEGRNVARFAVGRNYHDVAAEHLAVATEILRRAFPEIPSNSSWIPRLLRRFAPRTLQVSESAGATTCL